FDNGAKILGLETLDKPQAGKPWKIILYWQPEKTDIAKQYQFSVRVVDEQNTVYGQMDGASLSGWLWQNGDTVINPMEISINDTLPEDVEIRVQLLMYAWPEIMNANALDTNGAVGAPWIYLVEAEVGK
ncbi:MAG TPA: hypothetical protein VHP83_07800, partial [Aggregatilineaceae bacterium]|nr:hypothetical protein [Aggregatilineaceae bacterium]